MKTIIDDEFLRCMMTAEAWKEISEEISWTEPLLEKYQDKIDWEAISGNSDILWTIPMLTKFKRQIHWDTLSSALNEKCAIMSLLRAFKQQWDWHKLSMNSAIKLTNEFLETFKDYIDWSEVIDRWDDERLKFKPFEFYEQWKTFIPIAKLQDSRLWDYMVEIEKIKIMEEMIQ
jgi:hypothetical protein